MEEKEHEEASVNLKHQSSPLQTPHPQPEDNKDRLITGLISQIEKNHFPHQTFACSSDEELSSSRLWNMTRDPMMSVARPLYSGR